MNNSKRMSKVRSKNTLPEIYIRKLLHKNGKRFRIHQNNLPGNPDIVLKKYNTIILVNGCFWHGHESCKRAKLPKINIHYWRAKIKNTIARDIINISKLKRLGWEVIIIWTCEIKNNKLILDKLKNIITI